MASNKQLKENLSKELDRLNALYDKDLRQRIRNNRQALGRTQKGFAFGANAPKQKIVDLTKDAQRRAGKYLEKELIKEYAFVNRAMEGDLNYFYKPSRGSGWTIGQGIDLSGTSREEAIKLGMPQSAIRLADQYKAWGKTNVPVPPEIKSRRFRTNTPEWQMFTENVVRQKVPLMSQMMEQNPNLTIQGAAILAQTDHWSGNLMASKASFKGYHPKIVRKDAQGRMYNPLADLVNSGQATDDNIAMVMTDLRNTMPTGYKQNRRTFERMIGYLTRDDIDARIF